MKRAVSGILFLLMSVGLFAGGYGGDGYSPTYFATVSAGTLNVTGLLKLADGTAAAPSLTFTNDTNTGIYNPTTYDNLMFTVGGTLRLTLNTTGLTSTVATTAPNFISNVAEGTAPYACTSTTKNTNLNADLLDDLSSAAFGRLAVANTWTAAQMIDGSADVTQFTIQGFAGQGSADYAMLVEDADGNDLFALNMAGNIGIFPGSMTTPVNYGYTFNNNGFSGTTARVGAKFTLVSANTMTSNTFTALAVTPSYNQATGTAANTDFLVNRVETAIGSGAQYLVDAQVGSVSKFAVTNKGVVSSDMIYNADSDTDEIDSLVWAGGHGLLVACETTGNTVAMWRLEGTTLVTLSLNAAWTATKDNASTYNVYFETGSIKIQNKVGDNKIIKLGFYGM